MSVKGFIDKLMAVRLGYPVETINKYGNNQQISARSHRRR